MFIGVRLRQEVVVACANCPHSSLVNGLPVCAIAGSVRCWDESFECPESRFKPPMRGGGDAVKRFLDATGISKLVGECGGCKGRQEALNKAFPFGDPDPSPGGSTLPT